MDSLTAFNYNPKKESMIIVGETQSGKTEHALGIAKMLIAFGYDVLILDFNRVFTKLDPYTVIHSIQDVTGKGLQILQPFGLTSAKARHQFFDTLSYTAYARAMKGNFVYMVDELQEWIEHPNKPIDGYNTYVRTCHNHCSSYIAIFQSTADIPKWVLSNAVNKFCLYMDTPSNVDYMKRIVGKAVEGFARGEFEKYEGIYKKSAEAPKKFKVEKQK